MQLINQGPAIYLDREGRPCDAPDSGGAVLVGAGGSIDNRTAEAHGIAGRLTPEADAELLGRNTGDPYVLVDGRAVAKSLAQPAAPQAPEPEAKAIHGPPEVRSRAKRVESKHISGPEETKSKEIATGKD